MATEGEQQGDVGENGRYNFSPPLPPEAQVTSFSQLVNDISTDVVENNQNNQNEFGHDEATGRELMVYETQQANIQQDPPNDWSAEFALGVPDVGFSPGGGHRQSSELGDKFYCKNHVMDLVTEAELFNDIVNDDGQMYTHWGVDPWTPSSRYGNFKEWKYTSPHFKAVCQMFNAIRKKKNLDEPEAAKRKRLVRISQVQPLMTRLWVTYRNNTDGIPQDHSLGTGRGTGPERDAWITQAEAMVKDFSNSHAERENRKERAEEAREQQAEEDQHKASNEVRFEVMGEQGMASGGNKRQKSQRGGSQRLDYDKYLKQAQEAEENHRKALEQKMENDRIEAAESRRMQFQFHKENMEEQQKERDFQREERKLDREERLRLANQQSQQFERMMESQNKMLMVLINQRAPLSHGEDRSYTTTQP